MGGAQGQAEDIRVEASQIMRIRNNLVKMYSLMTGQTTEQIVLDLDRYVYISIYKHITIISRIKHTFVYTFVKIRIRENSVKQQNNLC